MGKFIEQLAQTAAPGIIGAGMGLITAKANDRRQLKQQGKLQEMELKGNKQMLDWQAQKELEMWKRQTFQHKKNS